MKGCAWTALVLIVLGFILALAAGTTRGAEAIRDVVRETTRGKISVDLTGFEDWGDLISEGTEDLTEGIREGIEELEDNVNYEIEEEMIFNDSFEIFTGSAELEFAQEEISELEAEIGGGRLVIKESGDDKFHVEAEGTRKFQSYISNGVLVVKGTVKTAIGSDFSNNIVLEIPKGFYFEKVDMEIGAGQIKAEALYTDALKVEVGMGEAVIDNIQVKQLSAEVGMGSLETEGTVSEKAAVECGMGNVEMRLAGDAADFDYRIECGMGNVTIGDKSYSGLAKEETINNGSERRMDVECAVGNIEIRFR